MGTVRHCGRLSCLLDEEGPIVADGSGLVDLRAAQLGNALSLSLCLLCGVRARLFLLALLLFCMYLGVCGACLGTHVAVQTKRASGSRCLASGCGPLA